jgi:hypothetical protein
MGNIRITNREVYDGMLQVRDSVIRLENRVDSVLQENVILNKRVRALELRFYGILAGLVGSLTALGIGLGIGA